MAKVMAPTTLRAAVVVVAGAGGGAGAAVARRLGTAGATVVMADRTPDRVEPLAREIAAAGGVAHAYALDLLDEPATRAWASTVLDRFGRVDGVVHLVGGWRGGTGIVDTDLADWDWLAGLLIRTVQHTSRAFHDALLASPAGRFVLVSAAAATRPTAGNACYAAAKAAAEAWTLAVADSFRAAPAGSEPPGSARPSSARARSGAAASIVVVNALVTPAMRAAEPGATFRGLTDVEDLAAEIVGLWERPADEINGERLWLTE